MLQAATDFIRSFLFSGRKLESRQEADFRNPIWNVEDDDDSDDELYHRGGDLFHFRDAFHSEIDGFMREFAKSFRSNGEYFDGSLSDFSNNFSDFAYRPEEGAGLRDEYLLPGYRRHSNTNENMDTDLDGKIDSKSVSEFLNDGNGGKIQEKSNPNDSYFYGRTVISTTITKPDGTVETKKIVRDHRGNEEVTTVTSRGDFGNDARNPDAMLDDLADVWMKLFWK